MRFLRNFDEFFSGFRAKLQKRVRSVAFQSILRKRIRKLPKFLKILKIIQFYSILFNFIQFYSILFNRVLNVEPSQARSAVLARSAAQAREAEDERAAREAAANEAIKNLIGSIQKLNT